MTLSSEEKARIAVLFHREDWKVGALAKHFGVHHSTIKRILGMERGPERQFRRSMLTAWTPFIEEVLSKYPEITATRIYEMARKRGYRGKSRGHFRRAVRRLRPARQNQAYLTLSFLPAEQCQVDWGSFGTIEIKGAIRRLSAFVMVLSYSRWIFLKFFLTEKSAAFCQGHVDAFESFGGVPMEALIDNLKTGVAERVGPVIRFNDEYSALAKHYKFVPMATGVRKPFQKGRVERSIRYIRDSFFAGRNFTSLDDLNKQALEWCAEVAASRPHRRGSEKTVREAFAEEKPRLLSLPASRCPIFERAYTRGRKTADVRFDCNDYSIPLHAVGRNLEIRATDEVVEVCHQNEVIARHRREWSKGRRIEDPEHTKLLRQQRRRAGKESGKARLLGELPEAEALLISAAERGENLGGQVSSLLLMLETYGSESVRRALQKAYENELPRLSHVNLSLSSEPMLRKPDRFRPALPEKFSGIDIRPHSSESYDKWTNGETK